jgi:hypothetical protein
LGMLNRPTSVVLVSKVTPVWRFLKERYAPGATAPDESLTMPMNRRWFVCGNKEAASKQNESHTGFVAGHSFR